MDNVGTTQNAPPEVRVEPMVGCPECRAKVEIISAMNQDALRRAGRIAQMETVLEHCRHFIGHGAVNIHGPWRTEMLDQIDHALAANTGIREIGAQSAERRLRLREINRVTAEQAQ